jgi:uncharacterized protein
MMTTTELPIHFDEEAIATFCRERGIRRLSLFGSVVRGDYEPGRSDVDVLAEFEEGALAGVGLAFFGYGEELGELLGAKVDFCANLDRRVRARVEPELMTIYECA